MRNLLLILFIITFLPFSLSGINETGYHLAGPGNTSEPVSAITLLSSFPSELTVAGLISLANGNYVLQMGAFRNYSNASQFSDMLEDMVGLPVEVITEGKWHKVYINGDLKGEAPCLYIPVSLPRSYKEARTDTNEKKTDDEYQTEAPGLSLTDTVKAETEETVIEPDSAVVTVTEIAAEEPAPASSAGKGFLGIFSLKGNSPWLIRYNYFGKSVALVNALIFTIIVCFISMLILLVVILLNRSRMEKEARLKQYLLEKYQSLIIDYLFGSTGPDAFRKIASDIYRRQVLIDQIIDVSINLKGDTQEKLVKLYRDLDLDKDSLARTRDYRWHKKIKGFRELAFMGIKDGNNEMYRSLNSRNEILRMEAQISLVRLSENNHFEFLSQLKRPFSLWEQITLHDLIIQHDLPVPEFQRWLSSPNPTVVMFALRMIREFKQKDAEPELRKVLLHRDQRISQLAVEVAGDLDMRSTLDTMKRMYKYQEYNNCLEIIKSMGKMPDESMLGFLKLVLDKEDDVQLQIEAVKAIENMGETGVQALVKIMKSEYKNYNIIVRHVLDRRIY